MRTIWKFPLEIVGEQVITAPHVVRWLSVQEQDGAVVAWALVDTHPEWRGEQWTLRIAGTGGPANYLAEHYVGTVQQGQFVWHVFAEPPR